MDPAGVCAPSPPGRGRPAASPAAAGLPAPAWPSRWATRDLSEVDDLIAGASATASAGWSPRRSGEPMATSERYRPAARVRSMAARSPRSTASSRSDATRRRARSAPRRPSTRRTGRYSFMEVERRTAYVVEARSGPRWLEEVPRPTVDHEHARPALDICSRTGWPSTPWRSTRGTASTMKDARSARRHSPSFAVSDPLEPALASRAPRPALARRAALARTAAAAGVEGWRGATPRPWRVRRGDAPAAGRVPLEGSRPTGRWRATCSRRPTRRSRRSTPATRCTCARSSATCCCRSSSTP